ncbi:cupin domain-containing protein [Tahibacter caeni]|uniref:cupin domain-containing protein n=1 Tax=Tahibacter caeni TaxID=1453545 RepID=UPI0021496030|nr:cupin domain-containing protein [Tahibacter caeni]
MHRFAAVLLAAVALPVFALEPNAQLKSTPLLKTTTSWDGKPLAWPAGRAEVTALLVEIAPGGETGWHRHPVPSFGYVLEGTLEVSLADGRRKRLNAGEALAEVVDTAHDGRNVGTQPLKLLVFYAGSAGTALTQKEAAAPAP